MAWKASSVVFALVVSGIAIAGCSKDPTPPIAAVARSAERQILNVYNWPDYISEDTIRAFEAASGIKVNYTTYSNNDALERQLASAHGEHDVIFPSARPYAGRMIEKGMLATLDKPRLGGLDSFDADIMADLAEIDPNNAHVVPYLWGTTGLGINEEMVKAAVGPGVALDSWDLIFDPVTAKKLSACGIGIVDAELDGFTAALLWKGLDINASDDKSVLAVRDAYAAIRPYIRKFSPSSELTRDLREGRLCVVLTYSGDVDKANSVAQAEAKATRAKPQAIRYVIPREGALRWIDVVAIPVKAKNIDNAHRFIRYLMEPEVIAKISSALSYANANNRATTFIDKSIAQNPNVYPKEDLRARLRSAALLPNDGAERRRNAWNNIVYGEM
jgi:putrescine transport system substrate-binding protein